MAYTLTINGFISEQKFHEFKQTTHQIFGKLSPDCTGYSISEDVFNPHLYHLIMSWKDRNERDSFLQSDNYKYLMSAFNVLGVVDSQTVGETDSLVTKKQ